MEKAIHKRLISNTKPLFDELKKLGYEETEPEGRGLNQFRVFFKENRQVRVSHHFMELRNKDKSGELKTFYTGLTIHDELLKFFSQRNPIDVDEQI